MTESEECKFWKLDMMAAETVDIPISEKRDSTPESTTESTPEWLIEVMRREKGKDPKLIISRTVCNTDLDKGQSCLSMHCNQLKNTDFLTKEEASIIRGQWLKYQTECLQVTLVDPKLNKHVVDLRKWNGRGGSWKYVLNNGWNNVVAINKFNIGDVIQVWSFRSQGGELCFALSPPIRSDNNNSRPSSSRQTMA